MTQHRYSDLNAAHRCLNAVLLITASVLHCSAQLSRANTHNLRRYRLGFGDLLPREQMIAHQKYVRADLTTPWGLQFDRYSHQSWVMSDHTNSALELRWHGSTGFDTSAAQLSCVIPLIFV